ncbi:MAG: ornithine cyclodeaminase [Methylophaga sp.]|nr:ornithine cyclodeaminase [Methylophaga sp.]
MKILTVDDIRHLINTLGLSCFFQRVLDAMELDFFHWNEFNLSPRHATHYPHGVIELMPCSDKSLYSFKYVNGHPGNPKKGQLNVVALGLLSEVSSGYPLMITEMTLLTALRTAVTGVLAAKYLARADAKTLAIIGTGAQAEFQVMCFASFFSLDKIRFYDCDKLAMKKFEENLAAESFKLIACQNIHETIRSADIIVTATAAKKKQCLFKLEDIASGTHIHAMGGDCPGKTELDVSLLEQSKIVVEYAPQSLAEGESQQCPKNGIYAELWELICKNKTGRLNAEEITIFDSVGFALEDFSILRVVYALAEEHQLGTELALIPKLNDPKNLYSLIN